MWAIVTASFLVLVSLILSSAPISLSCFKWILDDKICEWILQKKRKNEKLFFGNMMAYKFQNSYIMKHLKVIKIFLNTF